MEQIFIPPWYLRNPMLQTFLSSSPLRKLGSGAMDNATYEIILDAENGVRLLGFHSSREDARGMVILLHGWEGSANSAYMVNTARFLFNHGFDIFRLNLRDHGESHHLNEGIFYGTLIDETHSAVRRAAFLAGDKPVFILGFSLGGSFALRIASYHEKNPVHGLAMVCAINPPLNPHTGTINIDRIAPIRRYFLKKWKRSLMKKQNLFPGTYDFSPELKMESCMAITESLLRRFSEYSGVHDYFGRYTLTRGWLEKTTVPVMIIMSRDDPFILANDLYELEAGPNVWRMLQSHGGHCGYINGIKLGSWFQSYVCGVFNRIISGRA